jgi:hypothetical protein
MLTREDAEQITAKLKATIRHKNRHDLAVIEYEGKRITQFGIRRGSRKDQGHDHIPTSLHVSPHEALLLAQCPMSLDDWVAKMKDKGFITTDKATKSIPVRPAQKRPSPLN